MMVFELCASLMVGIIAALALDQARPSHSLSRFETGPYFMCLA